MHLRRGKFLESFQWITALTEYIESFQVNLPSIEAGQREKISKRGSKCSRFPPLRMLRWGFKRGNVCYAFTLVADRNRERIVAAALQSRSKEFRVVSDEKGVSP
jgi:hypothetical protein